MTAQRRSVRLHAVPERPNSPQKLARPGFGPAAEPLRNVKNNTASRGAHSRASHAGAPRAALASVTRALAVQLSV